MRLPFRTPKSLVLASVLAVSQLGFLSPALSKGGVSDGGGNLCYLNERPYLLELADLHHELQEAGITIAPDAMADDFGFSAFMELNDGRLKDRVAAILAANEKFSPLVTSWLKASVKNMSFSLTSLSIKAPVAADTADQPLCQNGNTRASILFIPPMLGFVDRAQFNSLDLDSQAGLLLHEAGRTFQAILKTDKTGQSLAAFVDLDMQRMVRTLFEVYKGRSTESVDKPSLIAAFTGRILISTYDRGFCRSLNNLTYELAEENLKKRSTSSRASHSRSIDNWQISNEQRSITQSLPAPFSEVCGWDENLPLSEFRAKAASFRERILTGNHAGQQKTIMLALADRLKAVMDDPFEGRATSEVVHKAVLASLRNFNSQIAHLQLSLSMISATAVTVKEIRYYPSLTMQQRESLSGYDYKACNMRENLREWMQTGRIVESLTKNQPTIGEILSRPNSQCSKSSSWMLPNNGY